MPDDDAAARDAAEEASAFSHPTIAPDATAAYGDHPDQVIDFYAPRISGSGGDAGTGAGGGTGTGTVGGRGAAASPGTAPVVVVLHGGAWRAPYDRHHITPFADFLARHGFAVANIEYRRGSSLPAQTGPAGTPAPTAGRWPETFDDIAAALDALPDLVRAALPQADPRRVVLTGHSAGGHLALWAAARHVLPSGAPWRTPRPAPLRGVVALAPIADFGVAEKLDVCGGAATQLLGGQDKFTDRRPYADPALLLPTGIATALVQGRSDIVVPQAVAEAYADAAAKAGEVVGLTLLEDVGHFPLIDPAADACAVVVEEISQLAW
ncbi:alpha/beta hydrolase [Streptomyces europaeiscabiei]|uniref:alpha/beta hydrolase n=1 Tax=Streptomyces europaeiscabiei TaxID=146819 RepID=UPI0029BAAA52|nr:alpha/beta hydrolase [Streptomyces europaeiscabiei]MDX3708906.1 alpha/beta hydrolase [Streptomyces europaeiscabiei]MDX3864479.1 alpha/beta hydrolase [Streptomyces europaeiscabiei]MDX3871439.1 alpha/beta hydrolase [Streptomyces europaeiscabiei]